MAFILWHVFEMHGWFRWTWWVQDIAKPLGGARFDPLRAPETAAAAIQRAAWVGAFYVVGVVCGVYHFANGLWTMGITWGVWTSPQARRRANIPCTIVGIILLAIGLGALVGMYRVPPAPPRDVGPTSTAYRPTAKGWSERILPRQERYSLARSASEGFPLLALRASVRNLRAGVISDIQQGIVNIEYPTRNVELRRELR
jgi:hypothetical protein